MPVTDATGLTLVAAPVGDPALGPVAFMQAVRDGQSDRAARASHVRFHACLFRGRHRNDDTSLFAVSAGFGHNASDHGGQHSFFLEGAPHRYPSRGTAYMRFETRPP
ncbi:MAG TPA: hypothetical protein VKH42_13255 [Vicinamibacterales bacterium]|nr:hypothetical protein [Vicinamibacterales bacterium]